jgi:hypothetical protein
VPLRRCRNPIIRTPRKFGTYFANLVCLVSDLKAPGKEW